MGASTRRRNRRTVLGGVLADVAISSAPGTKSLCGPPRESIMLPNLRLLAVGTPGQKRPREEPSEICFNSKGCTGDSEYCLLSNFYGPKDAIPEFVYQAEKFKETADGTAIRHLLDKYQQPADDATFLKYLSQLQPDKKFETEAQKLYWYKDGKPILGVLAKLVGGVVKDTPAMNKRLIAILELATDGERKLRMSEVAAWRKANINDILSDNEMDELMRECLHKKFRCPEYRAVLMKTGEKPLHERPMRGKGDGNRWTHYVDPRTNQIYGGDALGKLLVQVREELREEDRRLGEVCAAAVP